MTYVMERFADKATFDTHKKGIASPKVVPLIREVIKLREGGMFKEFTDFLSKDG